MLSYLIFFVVSFIIIFLFYNIFVINKDKALNRMKTSKDVLLVSKIGKVDVENIDLKRLVRLLGLTNAFIISSIGTIILLLCNKITNFYLWVVATVIASIVLLIPMIFICYKLLGKKLNKEGR